MRYTDFLLTLPAIKSEFHLNSTRRGSEENIKIKFVVPFFQCLGWDLIEDMDFELMRSDLVLWDGTDRIKKRPALIVEVKDWDEPLELHLLQCTEYAQALRTPWVVITSAQCTQLYCALLNSHDLSQTKPLLEIRFDELLNDKEGKLFQHINSLIGKRTFLEEAETLHELVRQRLDGKSIENAQREFQRFTHPIKHRIKTGRIGIEEFEASLKSQPQETQTAIHLLLAQLEKWQISDSNLRIRRRSKEIGFEYHRDNTARKNRVGLLGVYSDGHISFGLERWEQLGLSKISYDKLKQFPRKIVSESKAGELINLVTDALNEIR